MFPKEGNDPFCGMQLITNAQNAWLAEMWHHVWKTICRIEEESGDDLREERLNALRNELGHRSVAHCEVGELSDEEAANVERQTREDWAEWKRITDDFA